MVYCKNCGSEVPEGASYCPKCGTAAQPALELKLAYWGERFVAWLIDILILGAIVGTLRLLSWIAWPGFVWLPGVPTWVPFIDFGMSNVIHFLYWTLMEGIYGRSFGKIVMRIELVDLKGEPAGIGRATVESVGKAFLLPLDCILGWILYARKRQRMFNYLSGTVVVKT